MIRYLGVVAGAGLGMFIHVILFNLYLSEMGFREDIMGRLAAVLTLGMAAGTLPAGALAPRWGLKRTILVALVGLSLALAARAWFVSPSALMASSFLAGLCLGAYTVTNAPAIAALAGERRAAAFSVNISLAIGVGAVGGVLAGVLPGLLSSKRAVLLLAAALPLASCLLLAGVRLGGSRPAIRPRIWLSPPTRGFLTRYLGSIAFWFAVGAGFGPFFNVYLSRQVGASTAAIGGVFAISQLVQALAALSMAWWIARWGIVRAVVTTQVLASAALLAFLPVHALAPAAAVYILYMSLQVMSSPGLQNFLMDHVPPEEQPGTAAWNELTNLMVNAVVGWGAGHLIFSYGYRPLFLLLSGTGFLAAAVLGSRFRARPETSLPR